MTEPKPIINKLKFAINYLDSKYNFDIQELSDLNNIINDLEELQ